MYYLTVLEVRILKWVVKAVFLLEALGENLFPCLSSFRDCLHALLHGFSLESLQTYFCHHNFFFDTSPPLTRTCLLQGP